MKNKNRNNSIIISSNYNILKTHSGWNEIIKKYDVKILDMHEFIFSCSSNNLNKELHVVYFFQNINFKEITLDEIKKQLRPLIARLDKSDKKTILYYSFYKKQNQFSDQKAYHEAHDMIRKIEKYLFQTSAEYKLFLPLNLDNEFCKIGCDNVFDRRNFYLSKNFLSSKGIVTLTSLIGRTILKHNSKDAKLLILDLDNTLWGGVVGEDGIQKIQLGQDGIGEAFVDFQKKIKNLSKQGLLLAIASKNNYKDGIDAINKHKSMILKKDDFAAIKISWNEKSDSIKEISRDLMLGMDSFVFWDDNPIERDKVKKLCPEVKVVTPPEDVSDWIDHIENIDFLYKTHLTNEDKVKSNQYKIRSKFVDDLKKNKNDLDNLISKLKIKSKFIGINQSNLARAEQLCAKTNQFNLTTKRYNSKQIYEMSKSKKNICNLVSMKDVYGDHGIIAMYNVQINKNNAKLDLFLMSCRILGRKLENSIIDYIIKKLKKLRIKKLYAEFIPTNKNILCKEFLPEYGFIEHKKNKNSQEFFLEI